MKSMTNLECPVTYLFSHTCLSPVHSTGVVGLSSWPCIHRVHQPAATCIIKARQVRLTQVATCGEGQPACLTWGQGTERSTHGIERQTAWWHGPHFFAYPPQKSIIPIHNITYFSSIFQRHLMCSTKLLDLIWRWTQKNANPSESNKPYTSWIEPT